jgi:hypothetical protein
MNQESNRHSMAQLEWTLKEVAPGFHYGWPASVLVDGAN